MEHNSAPRSSKSSRAARRNIRPIRATRNAALRRKNAHRLAKNSGPQNVRSTWKSYEPEKKIARRLVSRHPGNQPALVAAKQ